MKRAANFVRSLLRGEQGQDLLEYSLLVALIALVAAGAVGLAGGKVDAIFDAITNAIPLPQ